MTRQEFIEKNAKYAATFMRLAVPCVVLSASAFIAWMFVHWEHTTANILLLIAIIGPIVACVIPLNRLHHRFRLWCPHCSLILRKPKIQQRVLDTGLCPHCHERIIDEAG